MPAWNAGYVTDTDCAYGFYTDLAPSFLSFAHFLSGLRGPDIRKPLTYCELGCGQGFSTNLLAAANPHMAFYATDFLAEHILHARDLAEAAGLTNVDFSDQAFAEYTDNPDLPEFDIVVMHGIYSWVDGDARRDVIRFLQRKLKLGGLVFMSYNSLPGTVSEPPVQFLLTQTQTHGTTSERILAGLDLVERLKTAGANFFKMHPYATARLDRMSKSPHVIAHEYYNGTFKPWYHADVAREMAEAKLVYSTSCNVLREAHRLFLTDRQQQLVDEAEHEQRETIIDFIYNRMLRRDIFVKGAVQMPAPLQREAWGEQRFIVPLPRADIEKVSVQTNRGRIDLPADIYDPVLDAFADEPRTLASVTDPRVMALDPGTLREVMQVLVGQDYLFPCLPEAGEDERHASTRRFNEAVLARAPVSNDIKFLASPVTGTGHELDQVEQLFLLSGETEADKAAAFAWDRLKKLGRLMLRDGAVLKSDEDNQAELARLYSEFERHYLPILKKLKIA
jgi:predicted O-methyltransferase YrrM